MSRLVIDVTGEQHQQIKALAALHGKTIKDYIMEKVFPIDEDIAMEELNSILLSRIQEAQNTGITSLSFDEVTDKIIKTNT